MKIKNKFSSVDKSSIAVNVLICFTLFIFAPFETFVTNKSDLHFDINDFIWLSIASFLIVVTGLILLESILGKWCDKFVLFLFGISIALYIQGNFLKNDFGLIDGQRFELYSNLDIGFRQTAIWICILVVLLFLSRLAKIKTIILYVSLLICGMQISTLTVLGLTSNLKKESNVVSVVKDNMFEFSSSKNIVVIMADAFEANLFSDILHNNPQIEKDLNGFTFYNDALSTSLYTQENMALLLTGNLLQTDCSFSDNIDKAYNDSSIYNILGANNFETQIYAPPMMLSPYLKEYADNIEETEYEVKSNISLLKKLYKISWFKYVPYWIKPLFWMEGNEFSTVETTKQTSNTSYPEDDIWLSEYLKNNGIVKSGSDKNIYRFFYMCGAHPPYTMNSHCEKTSFDDKMSESEKQYEQASGTVAFLCDFIRHLKKEGVFDNTAILFIADHGWDSRTNPVMLIKPFGAKNDLCTSNAPVSFVDNYINTLEYFITNDSSIDDTIFSIKKKDILERSFVKYEISESNNDRRYTKMDIYKTTGNAKDTGLFCMQHPSVPYQLGKRMKISKDGKGSSYFTTGISSDGDEWTWSLGKIGRMQVDFQEPIMQDLFLNIETSNYLNKSQTCIIRTPQKILSKDVINQVGQTISVVIPKEEIINDTLELWFEFPDAITPKELGINNDTRLLAIAFEAFTIIENVKD